MVHNFIRLGVALALTLTLPGFSAYAADATTTVQLEGGGAGTVRGDLRADVYRMVSESFGQSAVQERMARRAALVLQIMGDNDKPTAAELNGHLQLHLTTIACLRRATTGNDDQRDTLVKRLKDTVLNTPTRQTHYNTYQSAVKDVQLKLATDNDCARLEQQAP